MTKPIDHADPLHRLAYLAALWGGDVTLQWVGARQQYAVSVNVIALRIPRTWYASTVREAYTMALEALDHLTAEEDAREAEGEVSR